MKTPDMHQILDSTHNYHMELPENLLSVLSSSCPSLTDCLPQSPAQWAPFKWHCPFWGTQLCLFPLLEYSSPKDPQILLFILFASALTWERTSLTPWLWPVNYQNKTLLSLSIPLHYFPLIVVIYSAFSHNFLLFSQYKFKSLKSIASFFFASEFPHLNTTWHKLGIQWYLINAYISTNVYIKITSMILSQVFG